MENYRQKPGMMGADALVAATLPNEHFGPLLFELVSLRLAAACSCSTEGAEAPL